MYSHYTQEREEFIMKYEFSMYQNNVTVHAIVINPTFENGVMKATKIGRFLRVSRDGKSVYKECTPHEFIAGGAGYCLEEYKGEL